MKSLFSKVLGSRQGGTLLLASSYVLLGTLLRLGLLVASAGSVSWGLPTFAALFVGLFFDLFMAWFLTLPIAAISLLGGITNRSWCFVFFVPVLLTFLLRGACRIHRSEINAVFRVKAGPGESDQTRPK